MTKSELIQALNERQNQLAVRDVELGVRTILDTITEALMDGDRVEIRGFGSFSLHYRKPRTGRNPRTGELVDVPSKFVAHFKTGLDLKERVDSGH